MDFFLNDKCFGEFVDLIHQLTGISVGANKTSMVEGRLRKRLRLLNLTSYEAYLKVVKEDPVEQICFIDSVTTNETYFYRTPRIWEHIENHILPAWLENNPNEIFTAWSAAASTGAEAHTLGILCQSFKEKNPSFSYQIKATDISKAMIERCQFGKYSEKSIEAFRNLRPALFKKYISKTENDLFEVSQEVHSRIQFQQHNLFTPLNVKEKYNLILLRNVLIYFNNFDQEKVIALLEPRLANNGTLIIGESESLNRINTNFKPLEPLIYTSAASVNKLKAG